MRNKRIVLLVLITTILLTIGVFLYRVISVSPIKLPKEINLKGIQLTNKPIFTFTVKNESKSIVEISRIYTSCGCITVLEPTSSFSLRLNDSTDIKIQFDPSSMHKSGDDVYHEIYILISKPLEKEFIVKMKGKIL